MSDDTTKSIIDSIAVNYSKPTKIPSGHVTKTFYDCMRLTPNDLARLAAQATGDVDFNNFDVVVGIAYTGVFFAASIAGGKTVAILQHDGRIFGKPISAKRILLVDDVLVTGATLDAAKLKLSSLGAEVSGFAVIVDRSRGNFKSGKIYSAFCE